MNSHVFQNLNFLQFHFDFVSWCDRGLGTEKKIMNRTEKVEVFP